MVTHLSHFEQASEKRFALDRNGYVPYLSLLVIDANDFTIAHVGWQGLAMLVAYLAVGVAADPNIASPTDEWPR